MIKDGDKILVGLSGARLAALLAALIELRRFLPIPDICAATVDMGLKGRIFPPPPIST